LNADDLRDFLSRRPFVPVEIQTLDAVTYDVVHPDMALVAARTVALPAPGTPPGATPDRIHVVSIAAIARVVPESQPAA
jgi:hypothetical protein